jgi:hypothetical protein
LQPSNQNSEQAACILHKVTVPFSHQDLILAVSCLDQATANLPSDACFMHNIVHGTFFKEKNTILFLFLLFDNSLLSNLAICGYIMLNGYVFTTLIFFFIEKL